MILDDGLLCDLYYDQPRATDTLGGTPELTAIVSRYRERTGTPADESSVLTRLIQLRKNGTLKKRSERSPPMERQPGWGDPWGDHYLVTMPVAVTLYDMMDAVQWAGGPLPVTRAEVLTAVVKYFRTVTPQSRREYDKELWERVRHLFPEFVGR